MHLLQLNFWILAAVCQILVAAFMVKRKSHARYPVFFSYMLFHLLRSILLFVIFALLQQKRIAYASYFKVYWTLDAVSVALGFLLVYRVATNYFRDYALAQKIVIACCALGLVGLLLLNVVLVQASPGNETHRLISLILLLGRSAAIVQVGLVLVLYACSRFMALPWRTDFSFGVSLGLAICSAVELAAALSRSHFGSALNDIYSMARILAYFLAVVVWLVYISHPRAVTEIPNETLPASTDVDSWRQALKEVVIR